jgi:hydroxymethylbilane synthase
VKKLVIATRKSKLALWQSNHIKDLLKKRYPSLDVELLEMSTKGDKILDTPLAKIGGKGLFTKELEEAMLRGEAHIAVHSLKDVPMEFPKGLILGAVTKREDPRDALLSQNYKSIDELPNGAIVGTTSLRRRMQLLSYRDDLIVKSLRGNVNTRIDKLKNGEFDAIILATAGLNRLGLTKEVRYMTPIAVTEMIPAMGQAALGIEAVDDKEVLEIISFLNDEKAYIETKVERDFVTILEGGCQVPIGVHAKLSDEEQKITVRAIIGMPDGSKMLKKKKFCTKSAFKQMGRELAEEMIEEGAVKLLREAERMAQEIL